MGFVTGPKVVVEAINIHVCVNFCLQGASLMFGIQTSSANLQPSSTSQAIAYALLAEWGYETFFKHTEQVADFYREKRDIFAKALEKNMKGLAEWTIPNAGMFFWYASVSIVLPHN
jgi:tryptophan aminotransferase